MSNGMHACYQLRHKLYWYRQNISRTKSQNLNVSRLVLQLFLLKSIEDQC